MKALPDALALDGECSSGAASREPLDPTPPESPLSETAAAFVCARHGRPRSEGHRPALDLEGKVFGRLTAIERAPNRDTGHTLWRCRCQCGARVTVETQCLVRGKTTSCGCYRSQLGRVAVVANGLTRFGRGGRP